MKYKLAIFDMDGTILDTLEDLKNATNYALRTHGLPERTLDEVRSFVGNGILLLIQRAVPAHTAEPTIQAVFQTFTAYYAEHCADATKPYDGIVPLIQALRTAGIKTAVVSNKADFAVQELVIEYFDGCFDAAVGERKGMNKKPAPDSVYEVLSLLEIDKSEAVYIGDSDVDLETAKNSGLPCIAVEWGFRTHDFLIEHGADILVSKPEEILELLLK
jgi:phosphoglycolate phosphatase